MMKGFGRLLAALCLLAAGRPIPAQVIEYESHGLRYQAATKGGLTVLFAELPGHVREFAILQVAVTNGSPIAWTVKPEDFVFERSDGQQIRPTPARSVVDIMLERGQRADAIKLVNTYEAALYGLSAHRSTNGYEQRRQSAQAEMVSAKLKAAATASALVLVPTKLGPGDSTDGAVFFPNAGKHLGAGKLVVRVGGEVFQFDNYATPNP